MTDYTPHQKRIIERYYDHRDSIMLERLSNLVGELYLATDEKARDRLWSRVAAALKNLKVPETIAAHILNKRSPEVLADHVKDWMQKGPRG